MTEIQPAVSIKELMVATGKSKSAVYEMLADGDIPGYRTKRAGWVIPRAWFEDWLHGRWTRRTDPKSADITALHRRAKSQE